MFFSVCVNDWLVKNVFSSSMGQLIQCLYSQTEVDDMIRKFANTLLMRTLGGCLAVLIKQPHLTLLQVFPISATGISYVMSLSS